MNLLGFLRFLVEKRFGYAVERIVAASLNFWLGRFRRVRGFFVKIDDWGALVVSEVIEEGEEFGEVMVDVDQRSEF